MKRCILVWLVWLSAVSVAGAQQKESGVFKMNIPNAKETVYVFAEESGGMVEGYDLATGKPFKSAKTASGTFNLPLMLPASKQSVNARVTGDLSDDLLKVQLPDGWSGGTVSMIKVTSAWQCGNHSTKHVAESSDQMKQLTSKEGCQLWQPVPGR